MFSLISNKHGACKFGFESVDVCVFCENETVKVIKGFCRTVHCRTLKKGKKLKLLLILRQETKAKDNLQTR